MDLPWIQETQGRQTPLKIIRLQVVLCPPWVDEDMFLDPPSEMFATFGESGVPSGQQDPWIFNDPWGGYQNRQPANRPEPAGLPTAYGPIFGPSAAPQQNTGLLFGPSTTPTYTGGAWGSNDTDPPPQQQTQMGDTTQRVEADDELSDSQS